MPRPKLILASSSPRRIEILTALGVTFHSQPADIDESVLEGETADSMVIRLASAKMSAISAHADDIVLGADTAVQLDGEIFGKPEGKEDALCMLERLSGQTHDVLSGVAVCRRGVVARAISRTRVRFRTIRADEARSYWASGEPADKAGAYAIQGIGGLFVEAIDGSYSGVVGLPVFETATLLRDVGFELL